MLELIKMKKERIVNIVIILLSIGLFISYFFTGLLALPFIAGCIFGERFINPQFSKTMENKEFKSRKITTADGTIMYMFDGKLHNWEGPALIPEGNNRKREYYLNGIKMSEAEYKDALRRREGLPWYKGSSANARF